jgi:hypothetical protein
LFILGEEKQLIVKLERRDLMTRLFVWTATLVFLATLVMCPIAALAANRTDEHEQYAAKLWDYIHDTKPAYDSWKTAGDDLGLPGPACCGGECKVFLNRAAASNLEALPNHSIVVNQHSDADGNMLAVTVRVKVKEGYDVRNADWYWAHYLPDGTVLKTSADKCPLNKPGFVSFVREGRLWVFPEVSADLIEFCESGEPGKCAILPGAGPGGMTLKGADTESLAAYSVAKPGFFTKIDEDGRLWVCRAGSEEAETVASGGELGKRVIRPAAGPNGMTINGPDNETIEEYLTAKPGFATRFDDGRLWVFKARSAELADYDAGIESAKIAIRPGAGPRGMTLKSIDSETISDYIAAQEGFMTFVKEGRIWVFRPGSPELVEYQESGEPGKCAIRPAAGPLGMTVKSADSETIDAYLASFQDSTG